MRRGKAIYDLGLLRICVEAIGNDRKDACYLVSYMQRIEDRANRKEAR